MKRRADRRESGFTLVELLVTILLAGIVFAAMTPMFVNGLKAASRDNRRVIATNVAQAFIERARMLAFSDITTANLNSSSFAGGNFGTSFTPAHGGQPYTISSAVVTPSPTASPPYKQVTVTVSRPGDSFQTTVTGIVTNPAAITVTATSGPQAGAGPWSLTAAFKNWTEVTSSGVVVIYVRSSPTPVATITATPAKQVPTSASPSVKWTNLPGGMGYLYTVTCHASSGTYTSPAFHLLSNGWLKFDTNPGGS
jgi:prepilin-type N-terminal cleavage/methylation domain-containing protein